MIFFFFVHVKHDKIIIMSIILSHLKRNTHFSFLWHFFFLDDLRPKKRHGKWTFLDKILIFVLAFDSTIRMRIYQLRANAVFWLTNGSKGCFLLATGAGESLKRRQHGPIRLLFGKYHNVGSWASHHFCHFCEISRLCIVVLWHFLSNLNGIIYDLNFIVSTRLH